MSMMFSSSESTEESSPSQDNLVRGLETLISTAEVNTNIANHVITSLNSISANLPQHRILSYDAFGIPKEFYTAPPLIIKAKEKKTEIFCSPQQSPLIKSVIIVPKHTRTVQTTPEIPEKERIMQKLAGFEYRSSMAWHTLMQLYGPDVKRSSLCEIAKFISRTQGLKMDRDSKRRKDVLIKWYHDNWASVFPMLPYIKIENDTPVFLSQLSLPA